MIKISCLAFCVIALAAGFRPMAAAVQPVASVIITLDPLAVHQTMRGWEVTAFAEQDSPGFRYFEEALFDQAVAAGINRVRVEVRSGAEHSRDNYAAWRAAGKPETGAAYSAWRGSRYETVNDNGNARSINRAGYHFTELDETIDRVVSPLRRRQIARGEDLYVNLNYVAFTAQIASGSPYIHSNPAEYAEFMLAAFQHLQQRNGWVPDAIEVVLEPDNVPQWPSGTVIGRAIVATGQVLAEHGFSPAFIGPSTTCMGRAAGYLEQMLAVPDVRTYLKEVSYHRYCEVSDGHLAAIVRRAGEHGLATAMLEWWDRGNSHQVLHEDLKVGMNSAWQPGALAGTSGADVFEVDAAGATTSPSANTVFTRHYFRHVRLGARRIGAESTHPAFDPLAFANVDGAHVVVVKADGEGRFSLIGLPAGTYGIRYSTASQADVAQPDQSIAAGQALTSSIPAAGVIEVFPIAFEAQSSRAKPLN